MLVVNLSTARSAELRRSARKKGQRVVHLRADPRRAATQLRRAAGADRELFIDAHVCRPRRAGDLVRAFPDATFLVDRSDQRMLRAMELASIVASDDVRPDGLLTFRRAESDSGMRSIRVKVRPVTSHFWHFVVGELLPVVWVALQRRAEIVYVEGAREWGRCPLDRFYADISGPGLRFVPCRLAPHSAKDARAPRGWDRNRGRNSVVVSAGTRERMRTAVKYLRTLGLARARRSPRGDVVVQVRERNKVLREYYGSEGTPGQSVYGADRRHVPGLARLTGVLVELGYKARVAGRDGEGFLDQMADYVSARGMVLGHGAGMVWSLFLPPGAPVLEISSEGKMKKRLADAVGWVGCRPFVRVELAGRLAGGVLDSNIAAWRMVASAALSGTSPARDEESVTPAKGRASVHTETFQEGCAASPIFRIVCPTEGGCQGQVAT